MIRALIVDDEYLIRKGMMLTIAWNKYDIEIVGEAESSQAALSFLESHPVDLLITDITMPNMSGFELIEKVIHQYPDMFVVVITCHQDFEYLQKALRMGAIDYIVKTELEEEELDESLSRISQRIKIAVCTKSDIKRSGIPEEIKRDYAILLVPVVDGVLNEKDLAALSGEMKMDIGRGMLLYLTGSEKASAFLSAVPAGGSFVAVAVKNADGIEREKLTKLAMEYVGSVLPYEFSPGAGVYEIDVKAEPEHLLVDNSKIYQIKKEWSSFKWVFNDDEYQRLKTSTLEAKPDMVRLKSIFYKAFGELEAYLAVTIPEELYEELERAKFWAGYDKLTQELRAYLASKFNCSSYPDETVNVVLNALEYIKANFSEDFGQESVARMFNLSRSYFSKVFKDIVGSSFTDYIHGLRMEKAKTMLLKTNMPVFRITREVGFLDEKYFSKVFKEYTGMTPMEYRSQKEKQSGRHAKASDIAVADL